MKAIEMPKFGMLKGIKVVSVCTVIAGPFAAATMAENGAEVIWVESARAPDMLKRFGKAFSMEHRNQRTISLDWGMPEGRKILLDLIKDADIFLEASKAHSWDKFGMSDAELWAINPDLVITHLSGFGQTGLPEYTKKPAYDMIGQAFSGYMSLNGMPDPEPPLTVKPYTCDYFTGMTALWSSLAALLRARETGQGESIDVAMFESIGRVQAGASIECFTYDAPPQRTGAADPKVANDVLYRTRDGEWVSLTMGTHYQKVANFLGLDKEDERFRDVGSSISRTSPLAGKYLGALHQYTAEHSTSEVVAAATEIGLGCSIVMDHNRIKDDPHYKARNFITSWFDPYEGREVTGFGTAPKFTNNPSKIFRGSPYVGMDNDDILSELGYSPEQIAELYEARVVVGGKDPHEEK